MQNLQSLSRVSTLNTSPKAFSRSNYSLVFNGTTTDVTVSSQLWYQNTGYTVSFWAKGSPGAGSQRLLGLGNTGSNNQNMVFDSGDSGQKLTISIRNDANVSLLTNISSTTNVFTGAWCHIAWADNNGVVVLYINGVADATNFNYTRSGTLTINRTAIGALIRTTETSFFQGQIDDVRIWNNTVLTAPQIATLFSTGANPSTPTSWYKFDEGSGVSAIDSGSLASNGSATNTYPTYSTDVHS